MNKRVASLQLVLQKEGSVCAYVPNISSDCPSFLESLDGVLERLLFGDSLVLLGDLPMYR